jgi:tight adherence protein C
MDTNLVLILSMAFAAVAGLVFVLGQYYFGGAQLRRRLASGAVAAQTGARAAGGGLGSFVTETFTEERFGVDSSLRQKLRRELLRAGFFSGDAIRYYVFARLCTVVVLPSAVFIALRLFAPRLGTPLELLAVSVAAALGILAPDAFLSRRQSKMRAQYRQIFPDFLDLLMVCASAGLSIEAAFDRIRGQLGKRSPALGLNLELMGAEMRAGRSTVEALSSLADRLALDEATAFVTVLRHSSELGGDIVESLRVYSDEMRDKRMLRAEQKANELPVKMVVPLALGIFPVILLIVLLPVVLKLITVFRTV